MRKFEEMSGTGRMLEMCERLKNYLWERATQDEFKKRDPLRDQRDELHGTLLMLAEGTSADFRTVYQSLEQHYREQDREAAPASPNVVKLRPDEPATA